VSIREICGIRVQNLSTTMTQAWDVKTAPP